VSPTSAITLAVFEPVLTDSQPPLGIASRRSEQDSGIPAELVFDARTGADDDTVSRRTLTFRH
jgi:hypothetical protein